MQNRFKQTLKKDLRLFAGILLIVLIVFLTRGTWEEFHNIKKIGATSVLIVSILFMIQQLITGYRLSVFAELFGVKLRLHEYFGLVNIRSFANLLPFNAGAVHNALYLKIYNNLPLASYVSLFAFNACLSILASGIWGMTLLVIRFFSFGQFNSTLAFVSAVLIFAGILALSMPLPKIKKLNKVSGWIRKVQEGWYLCKGTKSILFKIILLHFSLLLILSAKLYIIFKDLDYNIDIPAVLFITATTVLLRFTTIVPGNIGVRESLMGGITESFGFSFKTGFLGSIIERMIAMFWTFLFGIIFSLMMTRGKKASLRRLEQRPW